MAEFNCRFIGDSLKIACWGLQYPIGEYDRIKIVVDGSWVDDLDYSSQYDYNGESNWNASKVKRYLEKGDNRIRLYAVNASGDWVISHQSGREYQDVYYDGGKEQPEEWTFKSLQYGNGKFEVMHHSRYGNYYSVVTASEWNDFIGRIYEWCHYFDVRVNDNLDNVDRYDEFTYEEYNRAVEQLKDLGASGLYYVSKNEIMEYEHFINLESAINGLG